jgi:hypothetical protein
MTSLDERIEKEVAALGDLPREELVARWAKAYGCPPPKGVKRGLLERAAAWHLQAKHLGGLSRIARKAIRDGIRQGNMRDPEPRRVSDDSVAPKNSPAAKPRRAISRPLAKTLVRPGTRLVREWNGRTHFVDVVDDGFVFDGKTYGSLSVIAKQITGAHWSGPRFFGL